MIMMMTTTSPQPTSRFGLSFGKSLAIAVDSAAEKDRSIDE